MRPSRPNGPGRQVRRQYTRPVYTRSGATPRRWQRSRTDARASGGLISRLPRWGRASVSRLPRLPLAARLTWLPMAAAGVAALVILGLIGQATAVRQVRIQGNHALATTHLRQLAQAGLRRQWLGDNVLLANTGALTDYLERADLGIKTVQVSRQLPHTLLVSVHERQPSLNWRTGGLTYVLDANATVIGPISPEYAKLPTVSDTTNLPVQPGDRVAPTQFVGFCVGLAGLLPSANIKVASMSVPATTSEVYVTTTGGLTLKFDTTRPAGEEVADLKAVQAELAAAKQSPSQYIDLRIPHKAYYK